LYLVACLMDQEALIGVKGHQHRINQRWGIKTSRFKIIESEKRKP